MSLVNELYSNLKTKMIMNYFKSLIVFTCITFCMASCSDTPEYQNLIPQNAQVVVSLNLKDILSKTNLPDGAQNQIKALAATQIAGSDLDQIANIIDGKQGVGIDISEPFYFFSSPGVEAALTMKVESQEKLDEFMDLLARQEICDKPKEKDGLKWTELMHEVTVAYNSETLVLLALTSEANAKITIKKLFNQSPDDSFCKTDSYNKLYSKNGEIRFYANGGLLGSNESVRPLLGSLLPDGVSPEYAEIITDITLGKGRLDLATELFSSNDDVQNHLEKQDKMFEKINGDFIAAPNDFVCWIGADVDGEKFIDRLMGIDGVKGAFAFLERGIDIESILKSIKGDVAFTIPTINDTPDFVMTAKTKNTDFLKDVSGWQETMKDFGYSMVENSKNNFSLKKIMENYGDLDPLNENGNGLNNNFGYKYFYFGEK